MIDFVVLKTKISVSPLFFAVLTLVLLFDKTGISGFAVLFSFLHEIGHILALLCVKTFPKEADLSLFGIHIKLPENLSTVKKCFVLTAGFLVNFFLAISFYSIGKTVFSVINLVIGIFTALPISSTDGGTVLKTILEEVFPQKSEKLYGTISKIFTFVFSLLLIVVFFFTKNYFILISVVYMIFCAIKKAAG